MITEEINKTFMKATIIGSDYLQKNGSVKFLEINTNTTI